MIGTLMFMMSTSTHIFDAGLILFISYFDRIGNVSPGLKSGTFVGKGFDSEVGRGRRSRKGER